MASVLFALRLPICTHFPFYLCCPESTQLYFFEIIHMFLHTSHLLFAECDYVAAQSFGKASDFACYSKYLPLLNTSLSPHLLVCINNICSFWKVLLKTLNLWCSNEIHGLDCCFCLSTIFSLWYVSWSSLCPCSQTLPCFFLQGEGMNSSPNEVVFWHFYGCFASFMLLMKVLSLPPPPIWWHSTPAKEPSVLFQPDIIPDLEDTPLPIGLNIWALDDSPITQSCTVLDHFHPINGWQSMVVLLGQHDR